MKKISYDSAMSQPSWQPTETVERKAEPSRWFRWWYFVTTPVRVLNPADFVMREADRKARLVSKTAFFFLIVLMLFFLASINLGPLSAIINLICLLCTLLSLVLNRAGKTALAGCGMVLGAEVTLTAYILSIGPLHSTDLQAFDLYVIINLLVVSLLPARSVFLFALGHSVFITVGLLTLPLTPAVAADLRIQTALIPTIAASAALQLLSAGVAYIWVSSATDAIDRANHAEAVAMLEHTIAQERASTEQEKRVLEESIQQLVQTYVAITQGQMTKQIPYPASKVLWPLVGAMNLLWTRLQRSHSIEREHQRLLQAMTYSMGIIQRSGLSSLSRISTGTLLDRFLVVVQAARSRGEPDDVSWTNPYQKTPFPPVE